MKGGMAASAYAGKKRWKGLVVAVLGLVFLSMLVPLIFLLGLHNGFHPPGTFLSLSRSVSLRSDFAFAMVVLDLSQISICSFCSQMQVMYQNNEVRLQ